MNEQLQAILNKAEKSLAAAKSLDLDPKFHRYLIAVQDFRSQGDDDYGAGVTVGQAQSSIEWALEFLEAAKAYIIGK